MLDALDTILIAASSPSGLATVAAAAGAMILIRRVGNGRRRTD
jgi:hypothetical protein